MTPSTASWTGRALLSSTHSRKWEWDGSLLLLSLLPEPRALGGSPCALALAGGDMPSLSPSSSPCRDIRLIEVTENICKRLLDYNLHKERSGSNRFAKVRAIPPVPAPKCASPIPALPEGQTRFILSILWIPCQCLACKATLPPKSDVGCCHWWQ